MAKVKRTAKKSETNGDGLITVGRQKMDATVVKLAAEELERKHKLKVEDGMIAPTAGFAKELGDLLGSLGYSCTPTQAIAAWVKSSEYFASVQKKTRSTQS